MLCNNQYINSWYQLSIGLPMFDVIWLIYLALDTMSSLVMIKIIVHLPTINKYVPLK